MTFEIKRGDFHTEKSIREKAREALASHNDIRIFYYAYPVRLALLLVPLELALVFYLKPLPINFSQLPIEGTIVLSAVLISAIVIYIFFLWKTWKPALVIQNDKLIYNKIGFGRGISIEWRQIEGLVEDEAAYFGNRSNKRVKIVFRKMNDTIGHFVLSPKALHKGNEAFSWLKKIIPTGPSENICRRLEKLKRSPISNIKYRKIDLSKQGITVESPITRRKEVISWDSISVLNSEEDLATSTGYAAIKIEYTKNAKRRRLRVRGVISHELLDFIRLLMAHVSREAIDPSLFQLLEAPEDAGKIDPVVAALIISGFILGIAGLIILSFYPPTIGSTWIYPLLLIPLCLVPLLLTIKLQLRKDSANDKKKSSSIWAALGFNLGTLGAIAILFMLSPASFTWLVADLNALAGKMDAAETHYHQAEKELSDNADFLFAFAQFYYKANDWEKAARYYIRAYEKDPTNWMAGTLEKIPDALWKAGLTDEASAWCDTIIREYSSRPDVVKAIGRKRKAITAKAP